MSRGILVYGLDMESLFDLISHAYPQKIIGQKNSSSLFREPTQNPNEIVLYSFSPADMLQELEQKEEEIEQLKSAARMTNDSIEKFHQNQEELYNEFAILSKKYDDQKSSHHLTLWTQTLPYHPELSAIPTEENSNYVENDNRIGKYEIGEQLGDGQYATVFNCKLISNGSDINHNHSDFAGEFGSAAAEYALKILFKSKITTFQGLKRIANEIKLLKKFKNSSYVIHLIDVIHTKTKLYLITDKGGHDLFDFFELYSDGVPHESWAIEIIIKILSAVQYCHVNLICHRDLKPENILIKFDPDTGRCLDLKLCDFGLALRCNSPQDLLCDFCGSPGFFAPETFLNPNYSGMKADVWSMGCIFLELLVGNELFLNHWMVPYEPDVLQNKELFRREIHKSTAGLPSILKFSSNLNTMLTDLLQYDPNKRPTAQQLLQSDWIKAVYTTTNIYAGGNLPLDLLNPTISYGGEEGPKFLSSPSVSKNMLKTAMNNREKQRNSQLEQNGVSNGSMISQDEVTIPPFAEQQTPTIAKARKIIQRGDDIRRKSVDSGAGGTENTPPLFI